MYRVYLGVGSNLGQREESLKRGLEALRQDPEICFLRASSTYETEPVGGKMQGKYLNAVWEIETALDPFELLARCHKIEEELGRVRKERNEPRTMDIDILLYGEGVIQSEHLKIPHPRMHERFFVLKPLSELVPEMRHPVLNVSFSQLLEKVSDEKHSTV